MVGSVGPSVTVWPARSGSHSPADPRSDCGQCPPGRSVRESPADQVAQVQRRGAGFEPGMVFPGAAIAQRDPTSAVVRDLVPEGNGHATLIRGSTDLRLAVPVFHPQHPRLAQIAEGLRAQFDPNGILNPGLMAA